MRFSPVLDVFCRIVPFVPAIGENVSSRSVAWQPLDAERLLEVRAHRQVEASAGGQRLQEPALVDRDDLAVSGKAAKRLIDDVGELGIVLAQRQRVVRVGEEIATTRKSLAARLSASMP